jgi:hypothetical protein
MLEEEKILDWPTIEADYRAGMKTLRTMAEEHGISEGAIRKRAKKEDWVRDLSGKIAAKAQDNLQQETARIELRTNGVIAEKTLVAVNAQVQTDIVMAHRADIKRARSLSMNLLSELEAQTDGLELLEELADIMHEPDEKGQDKRNELLRRVISLGSRATTMKTLADSLKSLIGLEREAFGIDKEEESNGAGAIESVIKKVMAKRNKVHNDSGGD